MEHKIIAMELKFKEILIFLSIILFAIFIYFSNIHTIQDTKEEISFITTSTTFTDVATTKILTTLTLQTSTTFLKIEKESYLVEPKIEDCRKLKTHKARNLCYNDAAEVSGNEKICEYILDKDIREHCIARVTLNESRCCEIFDKGLREGCLDSINFKKNFLLGNISNITCENISITPEEYLHLNIRYISDKLVPIIKTIKNYDFKHHLILNLARRLRDLSLCSEMDSIIINSTLKTRCYAEISRIRRDISICEFINWSEEDKEFCRIFFESVISNNHTLCGNLRENYYKDICYLRMAVIKNDESICYRRSNDDRVSLCISGLKRDNKFCGNIRDTPTKSSCYLWVAYLREDPALCNNRNMIEEDRDLCYLDIAIQKYNLTLCEKIKDADVREYCHNAVEFLY